MNTEIMHANGIHAGPYDAAALPRYLKLAVQARAAQNGTLRCVQRFKGGVVLVFSNGTVLKIRAAIVGALIATTLATTAHAQTVPPETYTRGCYQVGTTGEGFPIMACPEDGAVYYIDLDGQPYENAAGAPVYAPGAWVALP